MGKDIEDRTVETAAKQVKCNPYRSLLMLDRAGWAWEWLRRNRVYAAVAAARPKAILRTLRHTPLIALITLPYGEDSGSTWGLHFRRAVGTLHGEGEDILA